MRIEFKSDTPTNDPSRNANVVIDEVFSAALERLETVVPAGRARSLMITKLQEAAMWSRKGVTEAMGG